MKEAIQAVKPVFYPILGKVLGINIKSVTNNLAEHVIPEFAEQEDCLPNKKTGELEKHVYHKGTIAQSLSDNSSAQIKFKNPVSNKNRITVHIRRDWEDGCLPWMVAGRFSEKSSFGFSLQATPKYPRGQNFLNLVYSSPEKPAGFEPLYLKIQTHDRKTLETKTQYLKITLEETANKERLLLITASEAQENEVPGHLRSVTENSGRNSERKELAKDLLR